MLYMEQPVSKPKSAAPALERGLHILRVLNGGPSRSLEELAQQIGAPKSSTLRLLDTLAESGYVVRDEVSKRYRSAVIVLPEGDVNGQLLAVIDRELAALCECFSVTAEWYQPFPRHMTITRRREATGNPVWVRAQLGFTRSQDDEWEAVTRLAHALGHFTWEASARFRVYCGGRLGEWSAAEAARALEKELASGKSLNLADRTAFDAEYNVNGIRRLAAAVVHRDGALLGVLALAESYRPNADEERGERLQALRDAARRIEQFNQQSL